MPEGTFTRDPMEDGGVRMSIFQGAPGVGISTIQLMRPLEISAVKRMDIRCVASKILTDGINACQKRNFNE
jgi:hypothetical protein